MGILGLEQRLARTFETEGEHGVLKRYLQRSLLWRRDGSTPLHPITYPDGRSVPSWSWMAYEGAIAYVEAPFGGVDWNEDIALPFESGLYHHSARMRLGRPALEIFALARDINIGIDADQILKRMILDEAVVDDPTHLRCVVLGADKTGEKTEKTHYVLIIKTTSSGLSDGRYKRVGVGSLLTSHICNGLGDRVRIQ